MQAGRHPNDTTLRQHRTHAPRQAKQHRPIQTFSPRAESVKHELVEIGIGLQSNRFTSMQILFGAGLASTRPAPLRSHPSKSKICCDVSSKWTCFSTPIRVQLAMQEALNHTMLALLAPTIQQNAASAASHIWQVHRHVHLEKPICCSEESMVFAEDCSIRPSSRSIT